MINEGSTLTTCWIIFLIQHGATTRACNIPLCHFFIQITERSQVKLSLQRWRPYRRISCSIYKIWIIQSCYYTIVYMKYVMGYLLHGWIDFFQFVITMVKVLYEDIWDLRFITCSEKVIEESDVRSSAFYISHRSNCISLVHLPWIQKTQQWNSTQK